MGKCRQVADSKKPARNRAGFGFLGVLILIFVMLGAGFYLLSMAQHSGRTSHWFQLSQVSFSLADAAVKESARVLQQYNSASRARGAPTLSGPLVDILQAVKNPGTPVTLFSDPGSGPPAVQEMAKVYSEFSPAVEVKVTFLTSTPLWAGNLEGLPASPEERRGTMRLEAIASTQKSLGARVTRTITLDRGFKFVQVLPPLVGRFSLFVRGNDLGEDELNAIPVKFNTSTGNGDMGGHPLTVISGRTVPLVPGGSNRLDRGAISATLAESDFLDKQGWIFLGSGGAKPWVLRLAHGFGPGGESPLLPGFRMLALYKSDQGQDSSFRQRFKDEAYKGAICQADFKAGDGLKYYHHGFAEDYRLIGAPLNAHRHLAGRLDLGAGTTSPLRLFGAPDRMSPTLVFGPVDRSFVRRASLAITMEKTACRIPGQQTFALLRPKDHGPKTWKVILGTFGSEADYDEHGTNKVTDSFVQSLNVLLDTRASGSYNPKGLLDMTPGGSIATRTSSLLTGMPPIPQADGLDDTACNWFREATLKSSFYEGKLLDGLKGVHAALDRKLTFVTKASALSSQLIVDGVLDLPGVVLVEEDSVTIGKIRAVKSGGILIAKGGFQITGDILRQPQAPATAREPLTLVALSGDIQVQGASRLECSLVSLTGQVVLPSGGIEIEGSVVADHLERASLAAGSAPRTIQFTTEMDPVNAPADSKEPRMYYGGDDTISYTGGEGT